MRLLTSLWLQADLSVTKLNARVDFFSIASTSLKMNKNISRTTALNYLRHIPTSCNSGQAKGKLIEMTRETQVRQMVGLFIDSRVYTDNAACLASWSI